MKSTPKRTQIRVAQLASEGKSSRDIAAILGISQSTACRLARASTNTSPRKRMGRPRKLDPYDEKYLCRLVSTGKCGTAAEVQRELRNYAGIIVSTDTIMRALRRNGYRSYLKKKRPQLKKTHRADRRAFVRRHSSWEFADWCRVVWSDETRICLKGADGRERCFRRAGEPLRDHQVTPTVKHGAGSIMVWGCMLSSGVGNLCRVDGGLDAELYQRILDEDLLSSIEWYGLERSDIIFQQDNASSHVAASTRQWFQNNRIRVMKWPAQSPDLNPIEHLWDQLKRTIRTLPPAKDLDELWEQVQDAWGSTDKAQCLDLVRSMPRRLREIRKAKGGYTRY